LGIDKNRKYEIIVFPNQDEGLKAQRILLSRDMDFKHISALAVVVLEDRRKEACRAIIDEDEESSLNEDISIVPLAFPIVGGPAAILQVLICLQTYGNNLHSKLALTLASLAAVIVHSCF